jgi:DNA polymerase III delta prime subunit
MPIEPRDLFCTEAITADNVDFLIGRTDLIRRIATKLAATKNSAVIYGVRGVGKTTLAWQVVSVLLGKSPRFDKKTLLKVGSDRQFRIAFHKCLSSAESYGDLLMGLLSDNHDQYSFAKVFEKAFKDEGFVSGVQRKFGVNLFRILNLEHSEQVTRKSIVDEIKEYVNDDDAKQALFLDVLAKAKEFYHEDFLIVLDELDRAKSTTGLGNFLKDSNEIQFIFVGISENIESLINDHRSAVRKLTIIEEAPLLSQDEIEGIFKTAINLSNGSLCIDEGYIKNAGRYSGGIPYIAQLLGAEAVLSELLSQEVQDGNLYIKANTFRIHMEKVCSFFKYDPSVIAKVERLGDLSATEEAILKLLMSQSDAMSEQDVRNELPSKYKRYFQDALTRLSDEMGIVRCRNKFLSIPQSEIRAFVGFYVDEDNPNAEIV